MSSVFKWLYLKKTFRKFLYTCRLSFYIFFIFVVQSDIHVAGSADIAMFFMWVMRLQSTQAPLTFHPNQCGTSIRVSDNNLNWSSLCVPFNQKKRFLSSGKLLPMVIIMYKTGPLVWRAQNQITFIFYEADA